MALPAVKFKMKRVLLVIFLLGIIVAGYAIKQTDKATLTEEEESRDEEKPALIKGVDIYEYENNQLAWRFQITEAKIYEKKGQTLFTELFGTIFSNSPNSKYLKIKAGQGMMEKEPQLIKLEKNVHLALPDQSQIKTEQLVINLRDKLVFNHQPVTLQSVNGKINGHSLNYDLKEEILKLKQVKIQLLLE
jgi:LPS export ABC transporter protein LptC